MIMQRFIKSKSCYDICDIINIKWTELLPNHLILATNVMQVTFRFGDMRSAFTKQLISRVIQRSTHFFSYITVDEMASVTLCRYGCVAHGSLFVSETFLLGLGGWVFGWVIISLKATVSFR